ncbi:hypothetical protein NE237_006000 [Protea cynaroides]|uniref:Uncharacterized protein n=1 Tax=Protea cynaroides TaxID=273540 RepID=A0A9Q0KMA5_9MAGN|nr:hypothetical protein NE237_006000 [Protea cynaroides]
MEKVCLFESNPIFLTELLNPMRDCAVGFVIARLPRSRSIETGAMRIRFEYAVAKIKPISRASSCAEKNFGSKNVWLEICILCQEKHNATGDGDDENSLKVYRQA